MSVFSIILLEACWKHAKGFCLIGQVGSCCVCSFCYGEAQALAGFAIAYFMVGRLPCLAWTPGVAQVRTVLVHESQMGLAYGIAWKPLVRATAFIIPPIGWVIYYSLNPFMIFYPVALIEPIPFLDLWLALYFYPTHIEGNLQS